jgi:hypothetical protein
VDRVSRQSEGCEHAHPKHAHLHVMTAPHGALVGGALRARGFYAHIWRAWCRLRSAHRAGQRGVALVPILYTLGVKYVFTRSLVSFSLGEWDPAYGTRHRRGALWFCDLVPMKEGLGSTQHILHVGLPHMPLPTEIYRLVFDPRALRGAVPPKATHFVLTV